MSKVPMPQAPDDDPLRYVEGYDEAAMQAYGDARAAEARREALAQAFSERERLVLRFALRRFMVDALARADAAAQDKSGHFQPGAWRKFQDDAKDAESLLERLSALAEPPKGPRHA